MRMRQECSTTKSRRQERERGIIKKITLNKMKFNLHNIIPFAVFAVLLTCAVSLYAGADNRQSETTYFEDFDGDGLSNSEEKVIGTDARNPDTDGDGYRDGVEIESGFDPLKPAPGDRVIQEKEKSIPEGRGGIEKNLSAGYADIMKEFTLAAEESGEIDQESLDLQVQKYIEESDPSQQFDDIDQERLHIKSQSYEDLTGQEREQKLQQDAVDYYTALTYIIEQSFGSEFSRKSSTEFMQEIYQNAEIVSRDATNSSYFINLAEAAAEAGDQLIDVAVPETLMEEHIEALQTFEYIGSLAQTSKGIDVTNDPLDFMLHIQRASAALTLISDVTKKITEKFESFGIDVKALQ